MQEENLSSLINQWTLKGLIPIGETEDTDLSFEEILQQIEFLSEQAFSRYIPALYSSHSPIFQDRLIRWLNNPGLKERDKLAMLQAIPRLSYFSFDDFLSLYRHAFTGPISRWIWEQSNLSLTNENYANMMLEESQEKTWYVSVTDSMLISEFYHANGISGTRCRPDLLTLSELGEASQFRNFLKANNYSRLVILEDFVGGGTQASDILIWLLNAINVPTLFCPMLICPDGFTWLKALEIRYPNFRLDATLKLGASTFLNTGKEDDPVLAHLDELVDRIHPNVKGTAQANEPPYSPRGFHQTNDQYIGATVTMFSNTPDNTIPLIHFDSPKTNWNPIFPRVSRETP